MESTHNTKLLRDASEILETNSIAPQQFAVPNTIQPVIEIEPFLDVFRASNVTATLFTTPADKDFYLTNIAISASDNAPITPATTTVSFTLRDGTAVSFEVVINADATGGVANTMDFPKRGLLLAKNSAITCSIVSAGHAAIAGYRGSGRSGL